MKTMIHGGDIYSARERFSGEILDFSANINPLGMPVSAVAAAKKAIEECEHYPDPLCRTLTSAISEKEGVFSSQVICGNGAADLIFRAVLALHPRRALLLAPSFAEYAQALAVVGCETSCHFLREQDGFSLTAEILPKLTAGIDLLFLCNPNNPTGEVIEPSLLEKILRRCREQDIFVVLDECFCDFLEEPEIYTQVGQLAQYPNLLILKAFTKIYAMAGLRLGYALCGEKMGRAMEQCAQPWSVSIPAQAAGLAALEEKDYLIRTKELIRTQRKGLKEGIASLGWQVYGSKANFVFFRAPGQGNLKARLEEKGILIRGCGNYPGLDESYYRVAVRSPRENQMLLAALKEQAQN